MKDDATTIRLQLCEKPKVLASLGEILSGLARLCKELANEEDSPSASAEERPETFDWLQPLPQAPAPEAEDPNRAHCAKTDSAQYAPLDRPLDEF